MKILIFFLAILGLYSNSIHADAPPHDGRVEREKYISSFIKPGDMGAEIGVCAGIFAYHCLLPSQPSKLYLIDPWEYGLQADLEPDPTPDKQMFRDQMYKNVCDVFASYPNVEIIRMKSEDAFSLFPDEYFDYVYIDGEHSYAAVTRDLTNYFYKVKVGGYLLGDDYGWTGIADAVQDFLGAHQGEIYWFGNPYDMGHGQFAMRRLK